MEEEALEELNPLQLFWVVVVDPGLLNPLPPPPVLLFVPLPPPSGGDRLLALRERPLLSRMILLEVGGEEGGGEGGEEGAKDMVDGRVKLEYISHRVLLEDFW